MFLIGLHQKERSRVAYVWMTSSGDGHRIRGVQVQDEMTSSGDGHRVRGVQVQDEKPEGICFEACGPHHDNVHVKMGLR